MNRPHSNGSTLRELLLPQSGPCVSAFVTVRGPDVHAAQVQMAQLIDRAEVELAASPAAREATADVLTRMRELQADPSRWPRGDGTLAVFVAPGFLRSLRTTAVGGDAVFVGARFHLRPLLSIYAAPPCFYLLALSLNEVRLLEVTPESHARLSLGKTPTSFEAEMGGHWFADAPQRHSASPHTGQRRSAIVHGSGAGDDRKLDEHLRHWFGRISKAMAARRLARRAPCLLAATREHVALFEQVSRLPSLLPQALLGSPDRLSDAQLAERARPVVDAAAGIERDRSLDQWYELLGSQRASGDIARVLRAARQGCVQTLFLAAGVDEWGRFDEESGAVELHVARRPGDQELLGRAAIETLEHGGEVHEMAATGKLDGVPMAALLRS